MPLIIHKNKSPPPSKAAPADDMEAPSTCIIDGMSIVQKMKGDNLTFEDLADEMRVSMLG